MVVFNQRGAPAARASRRQELAGKPHKLVITLSNLFTTPLGTGIPFSYRDLTPVAMMALDEFVLWVNADSPYKTVKDYIEAAKAKPGELKMAGTGSKQEDQIITVAIEKATGAKFTSSPKSGGGEVAVQLVGKHVASTVKHPNRGRAQWAGGAVPRLGSSTQCRCPYKDREANGKTWGDIPTCKSAGLAVESSCCARSSPAARPKEHVDYYSD